MNWSRSRALALGGLAAGAIAFLVAVLSAFGGTDARSSAVQAANATITSQVVRIGSGRITVLALPTGTCFTVSDRSGSTHACPVSLGPTRLAYALTAKGIGGIAGGSVAAVIVRLTHRGTVWATLRDGGFYAAVPAGHAVRAVVKVLRDGSRTSFAVTT